MINYFFFNKLKKNLIKGLSSFGGRNNRGRICVRGQGGGNKRLYRFIDFFRRINLKGRLINILYDPNRTARLALVLYVNSLCSFILLQQNVNLNAILYSGSYLADIPIVDGFSLPLKLMPLYSVICNIEAKPFNGSILCRAAGVSALLIGKTKEKGILKLRSQWEMHLPLNCMSSYGIVSTRWYKNIIIKKAGKNRALGRKPKVRGVAMNPCDHPHGGGGGKGTKPMLPVNAWNTVVKWAHTKNTKKDNLKRRKFKKLNVY